MTDRTLAELLVQRGLLSPPRVAELVAGAPEGTLAGVLVQRGYLRPEQLQQLLVDASTYDADATTFSQPPSAPTPASYDPDSTAFSRPPSPPAPASYDPDSTAFSQPPSAPAPASYDPDATTFSQPPSAPAPTSYDPDATTFSQLPSAPAPPSYDPDATTFSQPSDYPELPPAPYDPDATGLSVGSLPAAPGFVPDGSTHRQPPRPGAWEAGAPATTEAGSPGPAVRATPGFDPDGSTHEQPPRPSAPRSSPGLGVGAQLGPYRIESLLGAGGMGAVFSAADVTTGRKVALKVIKNLDLSEAQRKRFLREGELTAALDHPNVVRVHAAGEAQGVPYLAYELIEGVGLKEAMKGRELAERLELIAQVADGLGFAHARGITHRDVKPDNALVDGDGRVHVTDFGLAFAAEGERLTRTGAAMGTPAYMAPEQVDGKRGQQGPPTDVWALGVLLYEALTSKRPFRGESLANQYHAILLCDPLLPREHDPHVPPPLEAVCLKAISKSPSDRYPDGAAFASELRRALRGDSIEAAERSLLGARLRRRRKALIVLAALTGLALVGLWAARRLGLEAPWVKDREAPRLELESLPEGAVIRETSLTLRGLVRDRARWVDVWIEGGARTRVQPGELFSLEVPLELGDQTLTLRCLDAAGNEAPPRTLRLTSTAGYPAWFARLRPDKRPLLPLPEGLEATEVPGEYRWARDGSILIYVPPGTYTIGGLQTRSALDPTLLLPYQELPEARDLTLTRGSFVGKYEVTWAQWERFMAWYQLNHKKGIARRKRRPYARPSFRIRIEGGDSVKPEWHFDAKPYRPGDDHPAVHMTWYEALEYTRWAGLRMVRDGEWEVAARGSTGRRFPWGEEPPSTRQNLLGPEDGHLYTHPVGTPGDVSALGCYDMGSNVAEWVVDRYAPLPEALTPNYRGPLEWRRKQKKIRCVRGGSWNLKDPAFFLASYRQGQPAKSQLWQVGFRVSLLGRRPQSENPKPKPSATPP